MYLAVEDKHNASMNTLRRNQEWSEKRRETLLARQTPQHVFGADPPVFQVEHLDRKSTRLNSSHRCISYAVFCLKKKKTIKITKPWEAGLHYASHTGLNDRVTLSISTA